MDKFRRDIILLAGILLTSFLCWLIPFLLNKVNKNVPATVSVYQDGLKLADFLLTEDDTLTIPWGENDYNLLLIDNGKVSVTDATCPDQLCVRQRSISQKGESIICLPHKLVLQIESKEESGLDAVTY